MDVPRIAARSTYFNEAEERAQVPFLHHHLLECDYKALEYTIKDHDITLRIPEGAVAKGEKIHIEIGVAMYGPFNFPEKTQPVSPIIWLCIQEDFKLKKPFELIIPHFLTGLSPKRLQYHQIKFTKASHKYLIESGQMIYKFKSCGTEPLLASSRNSSYGVIKSTHCCFYCIQANQTPELARDAGYCLARIENSPSHQRNEVYFIAVYFLSTCIKVSFDAMIKYTTGLLNSHYHYSSRNVCRLWTSNFHKKMAIESLTMMDLNLMQKNLLSYVSKLFQVNMIVTNMR